MYSGYSNISGIQQYIQDITTYSGCIKEITQREQEDCVPMLHGAARADLGAEESRASNRELAGR
jgi:hypothetical protein